MILIRRSIVLLLSITLVFVFGTILPGVLGQQHASSSKQTPQGSQPSSASSLPNSHIVTVHFDYDFTKVPACSPKIATKQCVKQFDVYDVSGRPFKLFSIPVPAGASGVVKGIVGQSPRRVFEPGPHVIAVTAESAAGTESEVTGSKITLVIPAQTSAPANSSPTVTKP
jgi:hypothetical protein